MPERRMLAKSIIDSDAFCNMPTDAQMLYVRLNMAADDDGFVSNPRTIMRMGGFGDDSMKLLIAKKFVLSFEYGDDFIFLIKHWKIHNYIQRDRYKASNFRELLREVYLDENKAYSLTPGPDKTPCIQNGYNLDTQVRLGKDRGRLGEGRLEEGEENNNSSFSEEKQEKEEASNDTSDRQERIKHFAKLADSFAKHGWDTDGSYRLAANDGISPSEIDEKREVWNRA